MEQNPSSEANSCSAKKEIPQTVTCRCAAADESSPRHSILFKIYFNIILPPTPSTEPAILMVL
jgi:hypothetical protein